MRMRLRILIQVVLPLLCACASHENQLPVTPEAAMPLEEYRIGRGDELAIKFFYIDITALLLFCVFLWLAIKAARRRDIPLHLRLITCTAIIPLEAALERTYIYGTPNLVPNFEVALFASNVTLIVVIAVLVAGEWWYGRLRWPFGALLAYYVLMILTTDMIARTEWFNSVAFRFANI